METVGNRLIELHDSLSMTSSQQDLQITSVYSQVDREDIKSEIVSVDSRPPVVKKKHEMKYMNLEKQQMLIKAGFLKGPYIPGQTTQQQSENERRTTKDECQQDFSTVLLPSFSKTRAHFFKQHLLNNQTELTKTVHTYKDSKGIRHNRKLSPLLSNEIQMLMNQSQQTNLPWTTTQYSLNNTHKSAKSTIKDEKKSLGVFPAKMRSQSINPAPNTAILNKKSNMHPETTKQSQNFQLKLTQTLSNAFYKPKQSLDKYQDTFTKSYLQGFQTQKQIKIKEVIKEVIVPPQVQVDPQSIPQQFQQTSIAGQRIKASDDLLPSCFCTAKYNEVCKRHTDWKPTIDNMLDLLESQVEDLQQDENAIEQNLDMIGETSEKLLTSRTDNFKNVLTTEYRKREEEIDGLETQVAHLNLHENQYRMILEERDHYKQSLVKALQAISRFEHEVTTRSEVTKREITMLTARDNSMQSELQTVKVKLEQIMAEAEYLRKKVVQKDCQLQESQNLMEKLSLENNRMIRQNDTFRKFFVLNNAILLEHKDNPAYIRQQVDQMYRDFGKATNNSGQFIEHGFNKIEKIVNEAFKHKSEIMDKHLKEMKFDDEEEKSQD